LPGHGCIVGIGVGLGVYLTSSVNDTADPDWGTGTERAVSHIHAMCLRGSEASTMLRDDINYLHVGEGGESGTRESMGLSLYMGSPFENIHEEYSRARTRLSSDRKMTTTKRAEAYAKEGTQTGLSDGCAAYSLLRRPALPHGKDLSAELGAWGKNVTVSTGLTPR
jgi:hypothetical protein